MEEKAIRIWARIMFLIRIRPLSRAIRFHKRTKRNGGFRLLFVDGYRVTSFVPKWKLNINKSTSNKFTFSSNKLWTYWWFFNTLKYIIYAFNVVRLYTLTLTLFHYIFWTQWYFIVFFYSIYGCQCTVFALMRRQLFETSYETFI